MELSVFDFHAKHPALAADRHVMSYILQFPDHCTSAASRGNISIHRVRTPAHEHPAPLHDSFWRGLPDVILQSSRAGSLARPSSLCSQTIRSLILSPPFLHSQPWLEDIPSMGSGRSVSLESNMPRMIAIPWISLRSRLRLVLVLSHRGQHGAGYGRTASRVTKISKSLRWTRAIRRTPLRLMR